MFDHQSLIDLMFYHGLQVSASDRTSVLTVVGAVEEAGAEEGRELEPTGSPRTGRKGSGYRGCEVENRVVSTRPAVM